MDAPIIRVISQRHSADCGVACLAMICGVSYENALVAIAQVQPNVCAEGLWASHLRAAARSLGYRLRARRTFDLEADTGILNLSFRKRKLEHLVVLREGMVIETDGVLWDADVYLRHQRAQPLILFTVDAA